MATGDSYRVTFFGTCAGQQVMSTLAVGIKTAEPDDAIRLTFANDWKNVFQPYQHPTGVWASYQFTQLWGPSMTINAPKCTRDGGQAFAGVLSPPLAGALGLNQALPPQCAMVITMATGLVGRRRRGRSYMFGWGEQDQDNGTWNSTIMGQVSANLTTFFNKYKSGGTSTSFVLGVWSERLASGCVPGPGGKGHTQVDTPHPEQAFTPVTEYRLRPVVYTQRRRTIGVGR